MKHFYLILIFLFFGPGSAYGEIPTKLICEQWRNESRELTRQMPIQIDYATSWVGAEAIYLNGRCHITHIMQVNDEKFLEGEAQLIDADSHEEALMIVRDFVSSDEGHEALKQYVLEDNLSFARELIGGVNNVTLARRYITTGTIKPFMIEITSEMLQ